MIEGTAESVETAKRLINEKIGGGGGYGGGGGGQGRARGGGQAGRRGCGQAGTLGDGQAGRRGGGRGGSKQGDAVVYGMGLRDVETEKARLDADIEDYMNKKH